MLMVADRDSRAAAQGPVRARRLPKHGEPAGRDGSETSEFGQAQLARIQRARILAGANTAAAEQGVSSLSVAEIVTRAGVSRRTFYELFADRDECLVAAFNEALAAAATPVLLAMAAQRRWVDRLRAGIGAFLAFLDEEPLLGRMLVCESLSGGPALAARRAEVTRSLAGFVAEGAQESRLGAGMSALQAEASVGGALAILQNLLVSGAREPYVNLCGPLTAMVAMPYVGPARAQRELERPAPVLDKRARGEREEALLDPLKGTGLRLTYRTVRVLAAIGESAGASNREVGALAGVSDQGQMSKLLRRLERAELVENAGAPPRQGGANAWRLTPAGERLARSIQQHTNVNGEGIQ